MGFTCNLFNFPSLFLALWPSAAWDLLAIYSISQICFWRFGQVLHGIYLQFIQFPKSVFGALAKCCMGFTCNLLNFPNLFLALWPSAAWDLLAIYSISQICLWRFGQVLHGIYLQFIQFPKSVFGALAKCCMGFTCNLFNFPNLFLALWPSAAWDLLAIYSISQICFWRFGQVLHGIYLQFIQFPKSVFGALAKCCMGFTCNLFNFPNLFVALWPSAAWDLLAIYSISKSVFGALAKCCMGFTCNLFNFPNLFLALWPSAAWDLLAIYSISKSVSGALAKCCMGFTCNLFNFPNLFLALWPSAAWDLLAIYSISRSVSSALAKCCMGFTCNLFNFPNLFRALWPSAAWDLLAVYSMVQICFWRFGQVLHGIYLQFIQFPNLFRVLWPSAAWDLLAIYSIFQICFWRFGQVLHGIYLQCIQFPNLFRALWPSAAWDLLAIYSIFQNLFLALWPSAAWDLLAIYSIFQICFWRFGQVLHGIYLQCIQFSKSVFGALAKCCMGFTCNLFNFPNLFRALWPSAAWDLLSFFSLFQICFFVLWPSAAWVILAIYSIFQICFGRFGQVLHGIYLQFIQFSKSVFGALAKCCMGFTCNLFNFPNLFLALWPSAAWDLLAIYSIFQICFWRFGQVLHGIYLQFIQFPKSVFGALAKCCMGFTCNLFNFLNLFLALWPSAAWVILAIYSIFQICFWRFGQVLHGLYLQFIHFSKSVFGALAKCCMGFTCNLFKFPNLFLALWPSAAWDLLAMYSIFQICFWRFGQVLHGIYLQFIHFSKSVFGALAKCCMGFTCNLFNFPNLFLALWPSAAWDLLAIYSIFQICFWRFGQVLHGIYLQCIQFPNLFRALWPSAAWDLLAIYSIFQNLFLALWPSAAWDLLAIYSIFQICFWRFGQVLHGIYLQCIQFSKSVFGALAKCCMGFTCNLFNFPNLFRALWPSAAWDLLSFFSLFQICFFVLWPSAAWVILAIYSIFQICFGRFGQVLHGIYLQFIQFSKSVFGALAKCCMGFTCNLLNFPNLFLALWPSAAWDLLAIYSIFQICFWRFGQVLHGIYLQFIQFPKSVFGALAKCCMGFTCNLFNFLNLFLALWPSAAWVILAIYSIFQICFWRFGQVLHGIYLQFIHFSKSVFGALAKCCMGFTCNLFNFPNLFLALWPSAAWDLLAMYSIFQICFWRFGQVLHGIYLQFIQFPKSVSGALAKCCMGFACNLFNFPNLFLALWPSAAWDLLAIYSIFQICFWRFGQVLHGIYLQFIQFSKSVSGALAKCCMGFTCNLFTFPHLSSALWPSAAWDLLAIYSIFQICFWRFGQVLHESYFQFIQFSKSVFGALAKCCMGFTCNLFTFPNLFLALWPSAEWDLLAIYSLFQICFWRFGQVLHGIYLQFIQFSKSVFGALAKCCMGFTCNLFNFPNLFLALWPSAAWIYLQFIHFSKSVFGALAKCCMGFTCNLFNFPNLFLALWPSAAWDLLAIYSISKSVSGALAKCCMGFTCNLFHFQICFWRFGQVLHGIYLQFIHFSKSVFGALAKCCVGLTCNAFNFPNLFLALWPSAAWDLLSIYSIFQICFWRFGQVLHGIHLQFIHVSKSVLCALAKCCIGIYLQCIQFSKSVFGALAKWCMEFTCNLFNFPNLFLALWPSAAWVILAIYSISKSVSGALAKCCMGFTCNLFTFPNLFLALWPSAAWDLLAIYSISQICFGALAKCCIGIYLQCIQFSKSVFGALAKCCMGFTCNLFNFPNLFLALWPSAAWVILAIYSISKSVSGALAKCCMGFTCNVFNFPNLFLVLWPSAAWDLLLIYSIFQICFCRFCQVLHGIYFHFFFTFPNLSSALWPSAAWDSLAICCLFQICFWRFGQVLHGIYLQFIKFSKSVLGAFAKCCMGFTCNLFNFPNLFLALWPSAAWDLLAIYSISQICFWRFGQVLHGIYLQFIHFSKSVFGAWAKCCMGFTFIFFTFPNLFLALWPSAAWDLLAIYSISQICFWRFGQVLHGIYLQFIQFPKSVFGALAKCCMGFTCNLFNFPNLFFALWPSAAWALLAIYSLFQICFRRFAVVLVQFGLVSVSSICYSPGSVHVRFRFLRFLVDFGLVRFGVWNILH